MHPPIPVKIIHQKYLLDFQTDVGPVVRMLDGITHRLPDNKFGRWYVRAHLRPMEATENGKMWYLSDDPMSFKFPSFITNKAKDYQQIALARMLISSCALWLDMGLGKTFVSLAYCMKTFEEGKGNIFLILCPVSCFVTWEDEIEKHVAKESNRQIILAHGPRKAKKLQALRLSDTKQPTFIITSYESVSAVAKDLVQLPIYAIFLDESSRIKNQDALRTKNVFELSSNLHQMKRFLLSGTPSTTSPLGFYSQYEFLGRGKSGHTNFFSFKTEFVTSKLFMRVKISPQREAHVLADPAEETQRWLENNKPSGATKSYAELGYQFNRKPGPKTLQILHYYSRILGVKNIDKLNKITKLNAFTLKKEDVLTDFPAKNFVRRSIKLTLEQQKLYDEVLLQNQATLQSGVVKFSDRSSPFCKLHQIANGILLNQRRITYLQNNPKIKELLQILDEIGEQKLIVWAPYPGLIEYVAAKLRAAEFKVETIHGGTSSDDRKEAVHRFQGTSDVKILIANPEVAGLGLNLTEASTAVFLANWWKPDMRDQAIDRIHRIGQKHDVTIIDLVATGTLEVKILHDLQKKIDIEEKIISQNQLKGES